MATITHGVTLAEVSNPNTTFTTGSFTPAANDLLYAMVTAKGTVDPGAMTDSKLLGWTKVTSALFNSSADSHYIFIANTFAPNASMTVTFNCPGDATTTGATIYVARIAGMSKAGLAAIRQFTSKANQVASPISSPLFAFNTKTLNPTIESMGSNETGMTPPTGWTEPVNGDGQSSEYHFRDSGFAGTNIGWADTAATGYAIIAVEFDTNRNLPLTNNLRPHAFSPGIAR